MRKLLQRAMMLGLGGWLALAVQPAAAQSEPQRIALWANGAPGFEARKAIPEESEEYWTRQVNDPSITAYLPPRANATGTAVLIVPGGGHRLLVTTTEGADVARWFAHRGVAAFVLRYRLFVRRARPIRSRMRGRMPSGRCG